MATKAVDKKSDPTIKLALTKDELSHLRDLMSIVLPPDGDRTLSANLASLQKNQVKEGILWKKIVDLCIKNKISVGVDAPDFYIDYSAPPTLQVFASQGKSDDDDD